ncbi:MAG: peptidogalycan biosysnthesis protein, partial [Pseudomonadota bacterium]
MSDTPKITVDVIDTLSAISAADWDSCACGPDTDSRPSDPFTTHRFLKALEDSTSVGTGTGWQPQYLCAYVDDMLI